jgi:predicted adenine nucleotide alpha hydrolase (AANH) superfamily ATPase
LKVLLLKCCNVCVFSAGTAAKDTGYYVLMTLRKSTISPEREYGAAMHLAELKLCGQDLQN